MESALASKPDEVVPYKLLPDVVESVIQVVYSRLWLFNHVSQGRGSALTGITPRRLPEMTAHAG